MRRRSGARTVLTAALAVVLMVGFALVNAAALDVPWLRRLETLALDLRMKWRGPLRPGPQTVIVMVDDASIAKYGRWPMPREKYARMVNYLHQVGAKVIAFDVLFSEPESSVPADVVELLDGVAAILQNAGLWEKASAVRASRGVDDRLLGKAITDADSVILPFAFTSGKADASKLSPLPERAQYGSGSVHDSPTYAPIDFGATGVIDPLPSLAFAAAGLGHTSVRLDVDGAPRYDYPVVDYDLNYLPSMPIRIVQQYLSLPWAQVTVDLGQGISIGHVYVPTDAAMRMLVNYLGPAGTIPTYSFAEVLAGAFSEEAFRDKIVLIGSNITGTKDSFQTPFTAVLPGVERMAVLVDSMLNARHILRRETAPYEEAALLLALGLALGWMVARFSIVLASIGSAALVAIIVAGGQIIFVHWGLWYTLATPLLAVVVSFMTLVGFRYWLLERESRRLREQFSRYLAPNMIEALAQGGEPLDLAGQRREITVLFCDIHDFRRISNSLDARALTSLVNRFFTVATKVILEHNGTIDKYIRDGLMAFWNAPVTDADHAERACRAALALADAVAQLNLDLEKEGVDIALAIGIGISTGPCTVGNLGSRQRFDYSALGAAADIGANLEALTRIYRLNILVSAETAAIAATMATVAVDTVPLQAQSERAKIYALLGDKDRMHDAKFIAMRDIHDAFTAAFRDGEWDKARRLLSRLQSLQLPESGRLESLYALYAERLAKGSDTAAAD